MTSQDNQSEVRLPRFYCPALPHPRVGESAATLDDAETRHARKVLRIRAGETIELFDGRGTVAEAIIDRYASGLAHCRVLEVSTPDAEQTLLTVAAAPPKGGLLEDMVAQLSQIGVGRLILLQTERTVVDPRPAKLERLQRITLESAKQCRRATLMQIEGPVGLVSALEMGADIQLMLDPTGETDREDLHTRISRAGHVGLLVGPEGGWTDREVDEARDRGWIQWKMAPHVLRIETAAIAGASIAQYLAQKNKPKHEDKPQEDPPQAT